MSELCPPWAPFFGIADEIAASQESPVPCVTLTCLYPRRSYQLTPGQMVFSTVGAAYGTSKAGIGIAGLGTFRPELIMKSLIPVVVSTMFIPMSGIIAVYGLVVSVLIAGGLAPGEPYSLFAGFVHLAAGLACGFTGLAAGYAIGIVGDACVRAYLYESRVFVSMVLILIFA
ncbi:V-ATPase 16 kDa proteolipid subunit 2 [Saitozyma sp. JCM 24511]|nr:V-ATPase 16 kDa proteolipid subunit 2 [Saitozyma sp. JCM 24511]